MNLSATTRQSIITEAIVNSLFERADVVVYNGNQHLTNSMPGTYPFFYDTRTGKVTIGEEGEKHYDAVERGSFIMPDADEDVEDIDFSSVLMGRYWTKQKVMGFWGVQPSADVVRSIADQLKDDGLVDDTHGINVVVDSPDKHREGWALIDHYLVPYDNYMAGNLESVYQDSEEFKKQYALHLADMETKHEKMRGYLKNRSQNLGKKLRTNDGEMSQSEWNSLHRTSENIVRLR